MPERKSSPLADMTGGARPPGALATCTSGECCEKWRGHISIFSRIGARKTATPAPAQDVIPSLLRRNGVYRSPREPRPPFNAMLSAAHVESEIRRCVDDTLALHEHPAAAAVHLHSASYPK